MWTIPNLTTTVVSTLVCLFAIGSWLNLCGVWIEFPLIVTTAPEGWDLPAKMGLISNLANIGVVVVALVRCLSKGKLAYEIPANIIILSTGTIVLIIIAFVWDKTVWINDKMYSVYLMSLSWTLALVDCTSSVTFLPFLDRYEPVYINAYFTGEALSNLLPALLGIAQGVGQQSCVNQTNGTIVAVNSPPRFTVKTYFLALSVIMLGSLASFIILCLTKMGRKKDATQAYSSNVKNDKPVIELSQVEKATIELETDEKKVEIVIDCQMTNKEFWLSEHGIYLFLCFWTSILIIGATPSIQSYSLNPYSTEVYHHTIIACQFTYPLMSLLGVMVPKLRSRYVYLLTIIGTVLFGYTFAAAKLSPCPPFVGQTIGSVIIAAAWILKYCVLYFIRILIGNYLRRISGHRGLFWFGTLTQIGSLIGAVVIYFFTDHLKMFEEREMCRDYSC